MPEPIKDEIRLGRLEGYPKLDSTGKYWLLYYQKWNGKTWVRI